jgi:UDP-N-acetylmuramoylalanine--D-glutamate ligase
MREPLAIEGKQVLVVGFGRSGQGAALALSAQGARVTVTDAREESAFAPLLPRLRAAGIRWEFGEHRQQSFLGADLLVVSPGVPLALPLLARARAEGVPVLGELEIAYRLSTAPFLAVTGTNGKSTVTALAGEILRQAGKRVFVGGNIGNALTGGLSEMAGSEWIVAEVSSFQLETIEAFRPAVAAILNLTPDHLDRYADLEEYTEAKARIFSRQTGTDTLILNADDPVVWAFRRRASCRILPFSRRQALSEGVCVHQETLVVREGDRATSICPVEAIRIKGVHNLENALAAAAAGWAASCPPEAIRRALTAFPGLEHRLEEVAVVGGARYINDSKGTNVGAVIKSLESFAGGVILIAGGLDKGSDFTPLRPLVRDRVKALLLLGKAKDKIREALQGCAPMEEAATLDEAVRRAAEIAQPGDTVLLSPACASFDMFRDFEDRGARFKAAVHQLATGRSRGRPL